MEYVIVAAGKGTRMRPYTYEKPKCLVPIQGTALIQWQIDALNLRVGDKITVVAGYKSESIFDFFDRNPVFDNEISFCLNPFYEETNCGFSMMLGLRDIQEEVIIINTDLLFSSENIKRLKCAKTSSLLVRQPKPSKLEQKVHIHDNRISSITLDSNFEYQAEAVGPTKLNKTGVKKIKQLFSSLDEELKGKVHCYSLLGYFAKIHPLRPIFIKDDSWMEIDDLDDWKIAERFW
jgi:L-glutamine-phosphate cytidylyltransferase